MSALLVDGIIWVLLGVGVVFTGMAIIGLLLFPDIRSRRYTAVKAGLIGSGAIASAVVVFALFRLLTSAGDQYRDLLLLTITLFVVIVAGNFVTSRIITQRAISENKCTVSFRKDPGSDSKNEK